MFFHSKECYQPHKNIIEHSLLGAVGKSWQAWTSYPWHREGNIFYFYLQLKLWSCQWNWVEIDDTSVIASPCRNQSGHVNPPNLGFRAMRLQGDIAPFTTIAVHMYVRVHLKNIYMDELTHILICKGGCHRGWGGPGPGDWDTGTKFCQGRPRAFDQICGGSDLLAQVWKNKMVSLWIWAK